MLKLVLHPYLDAVNYAFTENFVTLGPPGSSIALPHCALQKAVEIAVQDGRCTLINPSFDPSVTLNGQIAQKEELHTGDRLHIGDTEILFLGYEQPPLKEDEEQNSLSDDEIERLLAKLQFLQQTTHNAAEKEEKNCRPLYEPYQSAEPPSIQSLALNAPCAIPETKASKSEGQKKEADFPPFEKKTILSTLAFFFFLITLLTLCVQTGQRQSRQAAWGLADLGMGLVKARVEKVAETPCQLLESGSIAKYLDAVLQGPYRFLSPLNSNGHFQSGQYHTRVFSNKDGSHFLLFALPKENALAKLQHMPAYILDSSTFALHKCYDIKPWKDLLVGLEDFDTFTPQEVSLRLTKAERVCLDTLDNGQIHHGFTIPAALRLDKPEASQLIYNCPRYWGLTEPLVNKAVELAQTENIQSVADLLHQLNAYSFLHHLVLYVPSGIDGSALVWHQIKRFAPQHRPLLGYLIFDIASGLIANRGYFTEKEIGSRASILYGDPLPPSPFFHSPTAPQEQMVAGLLSSAMQPSNEEHSLLKEVADAKNALKERFSLWMQILSSEEMLVHIPREKIYQALDSEACLFNLCHQNQVLLEKACGVPLSEAKASLQEAVVHAQEIQRACSFLEKEHARYETYLKEWLEDLTAAKEEGVFMQDRAYHHHLIQQAQKKLKNAQKITPQLLAWSQQIRQSGYKQEMLAQEALHSDQETAWCKGALADAAKLTPHHLPRQLHQQGQHIKYRF